MRSRTALALPLLLPALLFLWPAAGGAQHAHDPAHGSAPHAAGPAAAASSPYAGQEGRAIKALSPAAVRDLRAGHGMGLAKAAELNHYPGPRHVLDHAAALGLTVQQRARARAAFAAMRERAVALGEALLAREAELDAAFATEAIDAARLRDLTAEIGRLHGALRATHLTAHLEMKGLLSPAQVRAYDRLRGYAPAGPES